ncbi:MAG TPA: hypothetical protein ENK18_06460 [Deltaproteobacteria bacterium]|nr:hypothetical protein [Deltaproteobacteria bacterium]
MDVEQWRDLLARARSAREKRPGTKLCEVVLDQQLEAELRAEQAVCLARAGRCLAAACERAASVGARLVVADGAARGELLEQYQELRREAKRARWELVVQREAIGLRSHHDLDESYPLPPAPAALGPA